jgi:predicted HAD superfamily Cof-like phosphohydrolase
MSIESIELWHKRARPNPTEQSFNVQLGCHLEEIVEMIESLRFTYKNGTGVEMPGKNSMIYQQLKDFSDGLKSGRITAQIADRKGLVDSVADQIVTGVGVGHCANMKITRAVDIVNTSNWSKFSPEGQPYFDQDGKVLKGPNYVPPALEDCV